MPTPTIETQGRFEDLLMHGNLDHHEDWSNFSVSHLSPEPYEAFQVLAEKYFAAGYGDPGLMVVPHQERIRLAKKYPKQFHLFLLDFTDDVNDNL